MRRTANACQRSTKKKKPLTFHRTSNIAFFLAILVVFLFTMNSLVKNFIVGYALQKERKTLLEYQAIQKDLEKQLVESKTPEYIERYAREKLDMLKSGEFVIIVKSE